MIDIGWENTTPGLSVASPWIRAMRAAPLFTLPFSMQRGFFFLLFKSRLLFDITFPAKFGVFANRILRLGRMFVLLLITVHLCTCTHFFKYNRLKKN